MALKVGKQILDENLGRLWISQVHAIRIDGSKECGTVL